MNEPATAPIPTAAPEDLTGRRIAAALIDIVLFFVIFLVMSILFGDSESSSGDDGASFNLSLGTVPSILLFVIWFAYFFFLEMSSGQTLGKKIMAIKVTTLDGGLMDPGKSALRTICRIVDGLPVFYLLGFVVVLVSKQKQRIGDMAAGTIIVRA